MSETCIHDKFRVDGLPAVQGKFVFTREMQLVGPSKEFDKEWSTVDSQGHFHAYNRSSNNHSDRFPTLYEGNRHVPCDNHCDGCNCGDGDFECGCYDVFVHRCIICLEEISVGMRSTEATLKSISETWYIELDGVHTDPDTGWGPYLATNSQKVSVMSLSGFFGVGVLNNTNLTFSSDGIFAHCIIHGISTTGRYKVKDYS